MWRWLHDTKHKIDKFDRPSLLSKFKSLVYHESMETFEEYFEEVLSDDLIQNKYEAYGDYLKTLHSYKEAWALCYRKELKTRGNNTNNNAEAQFLVLKDIILQRVKEYNINALFQKLTDDLNSHYKNKLLSVASGSFDGFYSPRFVGKSKKAGKLGFTKPTDNEFRKMQNGLVNFGNNTFTIPSCRSEESYLVDMNAGTCACVVGSNGCPCKHQYLLWALNIATGHNFLPVFRKNERKKFAEIAIGKSLPDDFYQSLHENNLVFDDICGDHEISLKTYLQNNTEDNSPNITAMDDENEVETNETETEETKQSLALSALKEVFESLKNKIEICDNSYLDGVMKMNTRIKKMSTGQLTSALHNFGSQQFRSKRITTTGGSLVKRSQKFKIGVQPESVKRRKVKHGSKRVLKKGRPSTLLSSKMPIKVPSLKRKHDFSRNVLDNETMAKKAGRSMLSKCKVVTQVPKGKLERKK